LGATPSEWRELLHPKLKPKSKTNIFDNIYYINGLDTDIKKGENNRGLVQQYLNDKSKQNKVTHTVKLVFNPTYGMCSDIQEAAYDYLWKHNKPIINPTSLAIISILYAGKALNCPLGLVASSQGTLITYNAVIAFSKLEPSNLRYLKSKIKMLHIAAVFPTRRYQNMYDILKKYTAYQNPKDPITNVMSKSVKSIKSLLTGVLH